MGQTYSKTIEAGGSDKIDLNRIGYIYCVKAADPVRVSLDGEEMFMEAGDRHLVEGGSYSGFMIIENPNTVPVSLVFNMGGGDFTKQIVKGELNVVPSIIKADGTIKPDDRFYLDLHIAPDQTFTTLNVEPGEIKSRQLIFAGNDSQDKVSGGPFQDGFLAGRNEVSSGGSGWGVDLAFYGLDGTEREVRRLAFRSANRFGTPKEISPIDEAEFFLTQQDGSSIMISVCSWSGGTVTQKGDPRHSVATTYAEGDHSGGGIEYNPVTKQLTFAYNDPADYTQIIIETLDYDEVTRALTLASSRTITGPESVNGVQSIATIDGEQLILIKRKNDVLPRIIRAADGVEVWLDTLDPITKYQAVMRFWQSGGSVYSLESYTTTPEHYIAERYPTAASYTFKGRVLEQAQACFAGLFKPEPGLLTEAAVTADRQTGGRVNLSGEVVRAALTLFFGGAVIDDYLDAVYGLEVRETGGLPRVYKAYTGNYSFSRANLADDFNIQVPGTLRLFVDSTIWDVNA